MLLEKHLPGGGSVQLGGARDARDDVAGVVGRVARSASPLMTIVLATMEANAWYWSYRFRRRRKPAADDNAVDKGSCGRRMP